MVNVGKYTIHGYNGICCDSICALNRCVRFDGIGMSAKTEKVEIRLEYLGFYCKLELAGFRAVRALPLPLQFCTICIDICF